MSKQKPNIIFIIADDIGIADLGSYGGQAVPTPHIDQMAREGLRFTQFYSGCSVCAPSRSVLMTGHHMGHTSVRGNSGGIPLQEDDVTVSELLKKEGYTCGGFGKWGLGDIHTTGVPEKHGFDIFYGYYHQVHAHTYYPEYLIRNSKKIYFEGNHNGDEGPVHSHYPIFEETVKFIRDNKDKPFYCYVPWTLPHGRYTLPEDEPALEQFKDKSWTEREKVLAGMISLWDRHIGELFALLKELDIDDNTIVLVTSDHGANPQMLGDFNRCGPYRGIKRTMYEGGIRTPFLMRWPDKIAPGAESDYLGNFADVLPTLMDIVGTKPPDNLDGYSLLPTLLNSGGQQHHDYLYWELPKYDFANRRFDPDGLIQRIRLQNWKGVRNSTTGPLEVYDLANDIGEENDLAAEGPDITDKLEALIQEAREEPHPQIEPEHPEGQRYN